MSVSNEPNKFMLIKADPIKAVTRIIEHRSPYHCDGDWTMPEARLMCAIVAHHMAECITFAQEQFKTTDSFCPLKPDHWLVRHTEDLAHHQELIGLDGRFAVSTLRHLGVFA